ncbi:MAG: hypothetical protein A2W91_05000 [Bacteroidetes bacterium GWF2_38_335]|nr:MAG: hypothetical protein A2W91_05000 [Bacteroidetes bacterium GWF2_38_335]OFY79811.1 MAG: hypothetical protein A2281_10420 [Bacteroidetes bacterium RIFOXYA12_FULL_38_20]HBS88200.1 hypothetical protein [Bacteroidales bacterium]
MKYILKIAILLINFPLFGQLIEFQYFSDTSYTQIGIDKMYKYIEVNDGVLVSGYKIIADEKKPLILKLNKNGEVIWSTLENFESNISNVVQFYFSLFNDGYIYGCSYDSSEKTFWKINEETGIVQWIKTYSLDLISTINFRDYDSTKFLILYSTYDYIYLATLSKVDGSILSIKNLGGFSSKISLTTDNNKNIYTTIDDQFTKYNGNNTNQIIWQRKYIGPYSGISTEMEAIHFAYIDNYDDIYIFGQNFEENGLIKKIDISTGMEIWSVEACSQEVAVQKVIDKNNKLYVIYRQISFGASPQFFRTSKVDKSSGNLDWASIQDIEALGTPVGSHSGNQQAAISLDVDCFGDIYQAGFYGDSNNGTEAWGINKLNGINGLEVFDLTITQDSAEFDDLSIGLASCVFENSPVFLGNLEYIPGTVKPLYVTVEPESGEVVQRFFIGTRKYQEISKTLDIINKNEKVYVLKQEGNHVVAEKYDENGNLLWKKVFTESKKLIGGQINVTENNVYISLSRAVPDTIEPFYTENIDKICLFKLNKSDGNIIGTDSINFSPSPMIPFELESDEDTSYLFFKDEIFIYYTKWSDDGFSSVEILEAAGSNNGYDGKINIVKNDTNSLYVLGRNRIYKVVKESLEKETVFIYPGEREYYDFIQIDDSIYLSGNDIFGTQIITSIDFSEMTQNWEISYSGNGKLYKSVRDSENNLYVIGTVNNIMNIYKISSENGELIWGYFEDSLINPNTVPLDMELIEENNCLAVGSAKYNSDENSDVVMTFLNLQGDLLNEYTKTDELENKSQAYVIEKVDTFFWIGGAYNRVTFSKEGFIYQIHLDYSDDSTVNIVNPDHGEISLFPNPSEGIINVKYEKGEVLNYEIFDLIGRKRIEGRFINNRTMDISCLSAGVYILKIRFQNKTEVFKVVKK